MAELYYHNDGEQDGGRVQKTHPLPVELVPSSTPPLVPTGSQTGLSVDATVGGVRLTPPEIGAKKAIVQVFTAPIRCWVDGRAPTTTTGLRYDVYGMFELESPMEISDFRAIRETGVSATLEVVFYA